ncbi:MAG: hypothetical protein Q9195_007205 [Heterodermia aff. obscurata]
MTDIVRKALLLVLDTGPYRDRTKGKQLDCSKTIWIMATTRSEEKIQKFWAKYLVEKSEERELSAHLGILQTQLKGIFIRLFGAPFIRRVSAIIPFLPFASNERAVIAYTFMRKLRLEVHGPIDVVLEGKERIADMMEDTELSTYEVRLVDGLEELEVKKAGKSRLQLRDSQSRLRILSHM